MNAALAAYQQRVPAVEIRAGDFLDQVDANTAIRGARGGRYRFDGRRVQSRVDAVEWLFADGGTLSARGDGWVPANTSGLRVKTRSGSFVLPGNLASLTTAVVRRNSGAA